LVVGRCDLVYYDLKLVDRDQHFRYTGVANDVIIRNLHMLSELGIPFVVRVPLIPGVTDTNKNLGAIAAAVKGLPALIRVDLLPYHRAAGGKYQAAGMEFKPDYDESRPLNVNASIFEALAIPVRVR
ncbi:MAG: glycyl-radical enzyme activating protein, partial [Anaerolineae bacterium]|nr:glycyl-radical enzyme activating protein [Anaerolineae bacterium]